MFAQQAPSAWRWRSIAPSPSLFLSQRKSCSVESIGREAVARSGAAGVPVAKTLHGEAAAPMVYGCAGMFAFASDLRRLPGTAG